jgi:hypothetical protein
MVNKYAGTCSVCGAEVPANGGQVTRRGRRWTVTHLACAAGRPSVTTFVIGGKSYTRNSKGRCIDAPCCGCCTI